MSEATAIQDVAAERAVLSGIFTYGGDAYLDVSDIVSTSSFGLDSNQVIYKCLQHMFEGDNQARPDYPSVLSSANALGLREFIEKPEELRHLRAVMGMTVERENVRRLAARVKKLEIGRALSAQLDAAKGNLRSITGDETIDTILAIAESPLVEYTSGLAAASTQGVHRIGGGVRKYVDHLIANPRTTVGISTGYKVYDRAIGGGIRPGTVNMIGARPKTGKTQLADNIALHIAGAQEVPVLNLDTEMAEEDHWNRMLANLTGFVTVDEIETGLFAKDERKLMAVEEAVAKLEWMPYDYMSIAGQPFEETLAAMRRWVTKTVTLGENGKAKPCVVIFDYLKLMDGAAMANKNMAEFQILGFMLTSFHNFMVRWGTGSVAFVQLNRDGIDKETTDVVSQSDRLTWFCSNLSLYKKKSDEELAEQAASGGKPYNRKLVPVIARHGAGLDDGDYINMMFEGQYAKITEGPTRNELAGRRGNTGFAADRPPEGGLSFGG